MSFKILNIRYCNLNNIWLSLVLIQIVKNNDKSHGWVNASRWYIAVVKDRSLIHNNSLVHWSKDYKSQWECLSGKRFPHMHIFLSFQFIDMFVLAQPFPYKEVPDQFIAIPLWQKISNKEVTWEDGKDQGTITGHTIPLCQVANTTTPHVAKSDPYSKHPSQPLSKNSFFSL